MPDYGRSQEQKGVCACARVWGCVCSQEHMLDEQLQRSRRPSPNAPQCQSSGRLTVGRWLTETQRYQGLLQQRAGSKVRALYELEGERGWEGIRYFCQRQLNCDYYNQCKQSVVVRCAAGPE